MLIITLRLQKIKDTFNAPIFLMKAGIAYEELGKYKEALEVYKNIQTNFSESREGRNIEKYIAR